MYSEDEITAAVDAGVMDEKTARAFRGFVEQRRNGALADEEHFRFLTGFGDIFVTVGILLLLIPAIWLGTDFLGNPFGFAVGAAVSWLLAEQFTRRRRQALPSIVLLVGFVLCVFLSGFFLAAESFFAGRSIDLTEVEDASSLLFFLPGLVGAGAAYLHWWRFRVPITVAAGALCLGYTVLFLLGAIFPAAWHYSEWIIFAFGVFTFGLAMLWDSRDTARSTRQSDVAFWLHLCAAPMLVHPVFMSLIQGDVTAVEILAVMAIYGMTILLALIIDRRAMLVSAAAYVLYALSETIGAKSAVPELKYILASLVLGALLLTFSVFWQQARRVLVAPLPEDIKRRLPSVG
ncbi:hypothetical protein HH303_00920 [Rhodospirillaceae bacterium KN72]|uniref:DUF2157 domain-containing protein n=1 Tax=Pacificispira spongiicola TaxID=2729598 RepID=A0A7Y0DWQ5_9PROT|nr:hypothetical protein [Pacificispira spongiicola]NMM43019.1 hypothetical protein [Pacificispira spongiicola]